MVSVKNDSAATRSWIRVLCPFVGELDELFWESFSKLKWGRKGLIAAKGKAPPPSCFPGHQLEETETGSDR